MAKKSNKSDKKFKKVILLILDGWGIGNNDIGNPIWLMKPPFINSLYKKYPWTTLKASGAAVGLPHQQVGNSEAGHQNLGAGRIVDQDSLKITKAIKSGEFFKNAAFEAAIQHALKNKSAIHLMGLLSNGESPHSDPVHLRALLELVRKYPIKKVYLHLFTDGRDSPQYSSLKSVMALERSLRPNEIIATIIGRFYAMDRKKVWTRTLSAYNAMTDGRDAHVSGSPQAGIERAYNAGISDEFIEPIVIYQEGQMVPRISNGDSVIFFNLRSDRARQLAKPFVQKNFEKMNPGFIKRKRVLKDLVFVAKTDFGPDLDSILTAFPSEDLKGTLTMLLEKHRQIYISESEKFAHVTFFFNGGYADKVDGEKRVNIPSPHVDKYDKTPAMSTGEIVKEMKKSIRHHDFIMANFACPDMIGHTGNMAAAKKTVMAVDKYVKMVHDLAVKNDAALIITADHGNIESMMDPKTKEIITEHTNNRVPFILIAKGIGKRTALNPGLLGNVAPTILDLFGDAKSEEMTKASLLP